MKTITIITEQVSDRALAAAIPTTGVASVNVSRNRSRAMDSADTQDYRSFRNPDRFRPDYRIELVVDDDAVQTVVDGVDFAYGAGLFSDAELWVTTPARARAA